MYGQARLSAAVQQAVSNSVNANNTAQWLRTQVSELGSLVSNQSRYVANLENKITTLEAQLQAALQRVAQLEERLQ